MCGPGYASLGVQAAGAISSAVGASLSASTQKMGLKLDAAIAAINADKARDSAREAVREGYQMEVRQRTATGLVKGAQRAAMGANGVDMTTGSALNRLVSTDYVGEQDAQTIRLNAARAAMGYRDQATNYDIQGTIAKGAAAGINPMLVGVTSLLGSASSIAANWYSMSQSGMFGSGSSSGRGGYDHTPDPTAPEHFRYGTLR